MVVESFLDLRSRLLYWTEGIFFLFFDSGVWCHHQPEYFLSADIWHSRSETHSFDSVGLGRGRVFDIQFHRLQIFHFQESCVMAKIEYSGRDNLDVMLDAKNYNEFLLKLIRLTARKNISIIDFGAGGGTFCLPLVAAGYQVACIETDPVLSQKLTNAGLKVGMISLCWKTKASTIFIP